MILIYTTIASLEDAQALAQTLLNERLIACANLIPGMQSIYLWEEKVEQNTEVFILFKTTHALESTVYDRIRALHSYQCPALFSLTPSHQCSIFESWIQQSTQLSSPEIVSVI